MAPKRIEPRRPDSNANALTTMPHTNLLNKEIKPVIFLLPAKSKLKE